MACARYWFRLAGYAADSADAHSPSSARCPPALAPCVRWVHTSLDSGSNHVSKPAEYMSEVCFWWIEPNMHWGKVTTLDDVIFCRVSTSGMSQSGA